MFDVSNLPFRNQFEAAVVVSGVCLAAAVVLREWFADREIRIIARVLGLAGWAVVVTFAWQMTETNESLATQLMVKGKSDATQISDKTRVVAVESEYTATVGNQVVSLVKYSGGRIGPVSVAARREDPIWNRVGAGSGSVAAESGTRHGTDDGFGNVRDGKQHAVNF